MGFYLVGLGLSKASLSFEALETLKKCDKVYLEGYTVSFPYSIEDLKASLDVDFEVLKRESVENESILEDAAKKDVALMVYGDPLSATTHYQLLLSAREKEIETRVFHNATVLTAVSETGLSLYKFGKVASIPDWKEHTNKPTSFMNYVRENSGMKAHSLVLCDIGLDFLRAIEQINVSCEKENIEHDKVVVMSRAGGEEQKIFYGTLENLKTKKNEILEPYCFVVPGELSFFESDALNEFSIS